MLKKGAYGLIMESDDAANQYGNEEGEGGRKGGWSECGWRKKTVGSNNSIIIIF